MSKGHKAIANYILTSYDKAAYMTAAKLGEVVGVSESTVVRFTTELGYEGYPECGKSEHLFPVQVYMQKFQVE
jgi:DNA-binding MurR/RpiR family transcriptional regulator